MILFLEHIRSKKNTSKRIIPVRLIFILSSIAFFITYIYADYSRERNQYILLQISELKSNNIKFDRLIDNLKNLLKLTIARIEKSRNTTESIKSVLNSLDYFSSTLIIPFIEKAAYHQLMPKPMIINRFGCDILNQEFYPTVSNFKDKLFIEYKNGKILVNGLVINNKNKIVGILSFKVKLEDFINFLGEYKTISYDVSSNKKFQILSSKSFNIYSIPFMTLKDFILIMKFHYFSILGYMLLSLIFISIIYSYLRNHYENKYKESISYLKISLDEHEKNIIELKNNLNSQHEEFANYQISNNALKKFYFNFYCRQEEHSLMCEQGAQEDFNGKASYFSYTPEMYTSCKKIMINKVCRFIRKFLLIRID